MLYIEEWGYHYFMFQDIANGVPRSSMPWADTCVLEVLTT